MLPADIKLIGFDLNRGNNTITLSGTATTRDALLSFQKVIEGVAWFKSTNAPTSQLFQKENINFEIRGGLIGLPGLRK